MPHDIKGQGLYAFFTLVDRIEPRDELKKELAQHVRKQIGPIATPDKIQFTAGLAKTRSGKIMRRILRKIAEGVKDKSQLGDTSTLADPSIVDALIEGRQ
jgi:acetyl-CoA synthetase